MNCSLSVRLGNSLQLILLLDGIRVGRSLSSVDEFLSQALSNGLDVSERSLSSTNGQQSNSLVDSSQRRDIDSLSSNGTRRTDSSGVFSGTSVDNSVNENLQGVLLSQESNDFKGVLDNSDSLELLTVVSAVHHQRVGETLDNGALSLSESLRSVLAGRVREVDRLSDENVVSKGNVLDLNVVKGPLVEKLDLTSIGDNILGKGGESLRDFLWLFNFGHDVVYRFGV